MQPTNQQEGIIQKVEFWAATLLYAYTVVFTLFLAEPDDTPEAAFRQAGVPFDYFANYFFPSLLRYAIFYLTFLLLAFRVAPKLAARGQTGPALLRALLVTAAATLALGTTDTHYFNYLAVRYPTEDAFHGTIFERSFFDVAGFFVVYAAYFGLRRAIGYLLARRGALPSRARTLGKDVAGVLGVWVVSMLILLAAQTDGELLLGWTIIVLSGLLVYSFAFSRLIPRAQTAGRPLLHYGLRMTALVIGGNLGLVVFLIPLTRDEAVAAGYATLNAAIQLLITAPLAWILHKRYRQGREAMLVLKKELGQSNANADFLRSQINPHFLFNALNTIYGTAIQEGAERTCEAVEKLSEMMRFMLHENSQNQIPLASELNYLENYISLQKLRSDPTLTVTVHTAVDEAARELPIAPMLLIPFVENAFKHGISLRAPSHIHLDLNARGQTLNLDLHNSRHPRPENDPERGHSGIGLTNVRQRLQLLYPDRHELVIRETVQEFFVHLTIRLA